jgi:hypothetical protein
MGSNIIYYDLTGYFWVVAVSDVPGATSRRSLILSLRIVIQKIALATFKSNHLIMG